MHFISQRISVNIYVHTHTLKLLTVSIWREENEAIVQVLAIALDGYGWVVGELEIEFETAGLERGEEKGMR